MCPNYSSTFNAFRRLERDGMEVLFQEMKEINYMKITLSIEKLIIEIILLPKGQAILQMIFREIYICVRREMLSD